MPWSDEWPSHSRSGTGVLAARRGESLAVAADLATAGTLYGGYQTEKPSAGSDPARFASTDNPRVNEAQNEPEGEGGTDMVKVSAEVELENGYYGDTYLTGQGDAVVDITCSTCKRLVYRKEIRCSDVGRRY